MNAWDKWVGRRSTSVAVITLDQVNRMAATLDRAPHLVEGDPLPHAWHWLYFHDVVQASRLGGDGHPALGVTMPPVPLPRRMWAGGELTFHRPLHIGEPATRTSTIRSVTQKQGRTGTLYFVDVEHEVAAAGRAAISEVQHIVYREMPSGPTVLEGPHAPGDGTFADSWQLDSTALFRYSALTFNGHRIHYDSDYARQVEGYPDLVVHGPLIATLLLDLAARNGRSVAHFRYRAVSPLFLPDPFTVHGRDNGNGVSLWAAAPSGRLAMSAEAAVG